MEYPNKDILLWWVRYIEQENDHYLSPYLPNIDGGWADRVMEIVDLIKMDFYPNNLHAKGALIFYKINKAHNEIDSNKRTAIIVTYLFYLINDYFLFPPNDIRVMAKKIARSKGRRNQASWLRKIEIFFGERSRRLGP